MYPIGALNFLRYSYFSLDFPARLEVNFLKFHMNIFKDDSDIDLLVEFEQNHIPGLIRLAGMGIELTRILGRKVDLRTPQDLSRYFRQEVLSEAQVQYAEG